MAQQDFDQLLGEGIHTGKDWVLKAELKLNVAPPVNPTAREIVEHVTSVYDEYMTDLMHEIERVLGREPVTKGEILMDVDLLVDDDGDDLFKAKGAKAPAAPAAPEAPTVNASGQQRAKRGQASPENYKRVPQGVAHPGTRGGKFYIDDKGMVRYGDRPQPHHQREATPEEVAKHYQNYRPGAFLPRSDEHDKMVQAMKDLSDKGDVPLSETDWIFLDWWHEEGLDIFMSQFENFHGKGKGLTLEDLQGDLSALKFPSGKSYEEEVHEFFMSQDWGDAAPEDLENDLKELFDHFAESLTNEQVHKHVQATAEDAEKAGLSWFNKQESTAGSYDPLMTAITTGDTASSVGRMIVTLGGMDLLLNTKKGQVKAGGGQLKGTIAPNAGMLQESKRGAGFLMDTGRDDLHRLSPAQLAAVYTAATLGQMFDEAPATGRAQYVLPTGDLPDSTLGTRALMLMQKKLKLDPAAFGLVRKQLEATTLATAQELNKGNSEGDSIARQLIDAKPGEMKPEDIEELERKARERTEAMLKLREDALKAQQDTNYTNADTMKGGRLDGTGRTIVKYAEDPDGNALYKDANTGEDVTHMINPSTGKPWEPFAHQKQAVNWMATVKRGILALDMGMGKTPTVIMLAEKLKQEGKLPGNRAILFLPPALMAQWPSEIEGFAPGSKDKILNLSGLSLAERKIMIKEEIEKGKSEYVLLSTGTVTLGKEDEEGQMDDELSQMLQQLEGAVFVDEAHAGGYKTPTIVDEKTGKAKISVRHQAMKAILGNDTDKPREYAFGMTGTPVPDNAMDAFHLTNLFAPKTIGEQAEWEGMTHGTQFNTETQRWEVSHPENIVALNQRLKPFVFHKLITDKEVEEDMGKQLPPKRTEAIDIQPSEVKDETTGLSQKDYLVYGTDGTGMPRGACDDLADQKVKLLEEQRLKDGKDPYKPKTKRMLQRGIAMNLKRQAAISPRLFDKRYKGPEPKIDKMVQDVLDHFAGGGGTEDKPIVIFSSYPQKAFPILRDALQKAGVDPSVIGEIHGGKSAQERAFEQDMTNKKKRKILFVGTQSGGAGLNLNKGPSRTMFLDKPWNHSALDQADRRVWRTGQRNPVTTNQYNMVGSPDGYVETTVAGKQTMSTALLGPPDPDIFAEKANEQIQRLSGRVITNRLTSDQMRDLLSSVSGLDTGADIFGEDFKDADVGDLAEPDDADALAERAEKETADRAKREKAYSEGRAKLKASGTGAAKLTDEFDDKSARSAWRAAKLEKEAKQRYNIKLTVAQAYEKVGKNKEADAARAAAEKIREDYPSAFGGTGPSGTKSPRSGGGAAPASAPAPVAGQSGGKKSGGGSKPAAAPEASALAEEAKPAKNVKPPGVALVHKAGIHFLTKTSPAKAGSQRTFGSTGVPHDAAEYLWSELVRNKDKTLGDFADRVLKEGWQDGKYTTKKGVALAEKLIEEFRKKGAVA